MKSNEKSAKSSSSVALYVAAIIVLIVGIASLINNIMNYTTLVSQYVSQGYPVDMVTKQLIPGTLLPGIFEPVGVYFGIAFALWGIGMINKKVSINLFNKDDISISPVSAISMNTTGEEDIGSDENTDSDESIDRNENSDNNENSVSAESAEADEQAETAEESTETENNK